MVTNGVVEKKTDFAKQSTAPPPPQVIETNNKSITKDAPINLSMNASVINKEVIYDNVIKFRYLISINIEFKKLKLVICKCSIVDISSSKIIIYLSINLFIGHYLKLK